MAFYDQSYPTWSGPNRTSPFDNRPSLPKLDENHAFNHQLEEVEKAIDNLFKSGKFYPNAQSAPVHAPVPQAAPRRDSVPPMSAIPRSPLDASDVRMTQTIPSRHYSVHSVDNVRPSQSYANLHSYYVSQRAGQHTPDDDIQFMQLKRRMALQRDAKAIPSEYNTSNGTSNTGSASSSLILDTSMSSADPVLSPLALSEVMDDPYANQRRRFRLGSASFDGLVGINESDLTPRAGPKTAGIIGSRTSPATVFDPFSNEFGQVARERELDRRFREQRSRGDGNPAESPSPRSATFSLFSSESTQTTATTTSSPESSPLKTHKPSLPGLPTKIAPIGTKRSTGSLKSTEGDPTKSSHPPTSAPIQGNAPLPSPRISTPTTNDTDKWNVFSGGWGTPFVGNETYRSRSATNDSAPQKGIWGSNTKGLGMTVGSGSVDVWG